MNPQTQNPYPYVVNNPANFADPAGFQAQEAVGTGVVICGAGGAESGGAACAVAVVAAAGVYVCVAGACEVLGEAGGTVIEGLGDLAGDALGGLRSLFPHGGGAPQADRNPPDFNPWYPGPNGWWRPGFDFGNLPPWMRNALRITAAGTIVGIVLKEVGDIFAPLLPGEKPPVRPVHLYYSP